MKIEDIDIKKIEKDIIEKTGVFVTLNIEDHDCCGIVFSIDLRLRRITPWINKDDNNIEGYINSLIAALAFDCQSVAKDLENYETSSSNQ